MSRQHTPPTVAVLGLGPMGSAVASALARAGLATVAWNRTPSRAEPLRDLGVVVAATPDDAVRAADVTFAVLRDHATTRALLASIDPSALAGSVVVNAASATPMQARETTRWATDRGIRLLAAAIMVPTPLVGTEDALVLYSGDPDLFSASHDARAALGGEGRYVGDDPGAASLLDVAMLEVFFTGMTGFLHAAAMVGASGVSAARFLPLARSMVEILPATLTELARDVDAGEHPGAQDRIAMELAALEHVHATASDAGLDLRLPSLLRDLAASAVEAGHGDDGWSRVVDLLRDPRARDDRARGRATDGQLTVPPSSVQ